MIFSVIYSVDVPEDGDIEDYYPPQDQLEELWDETEGDEQYGYGYLGDGWESGHHRKFGALLTRSEFEAFLSETGLVADDVKTMGSIGAPGFGIGWAPAISFNLDESGVIGNAYVTPLPMVHTREQFETREPPRLGEDAWDRVKAAVVRQYRYGL